LVQSTSLWSPLRRLTTSGRTPVRSAMMSPRLSGDGRSIRALIWPRRKSMSSSVTSVNGVSTRVSVVPITDRRPIGIT
jgi:hypothetical protein